MQGFQGVDILSFAPEFNKYKSILLTYGEIMGLSLVGDLNSYCSPKNVNMENSQGLEIAIMANFNGEYQILRRSVAKNDEILFPDPYETLNKVQGLKAFFESNDMPIAPRVSLQDIQRISNIFHFLYGDPKLWAP
jgi:hypothetical protein